ncbi:MAG: ATP-binding protein [Spirochaetota bacterium]
MSLNTAHEGYEYQDLLTAYFILDWILEDVESTFYIDKKEYDSDKFDDLTIKNDKGSFKRQIKYSNLESNHSLTKKDLSTDSSYNLAIDELFTSWHNYPDKNSLDVRLCLAWNEPEDDLLDVLEIASKQKTFINHNTFLHKINPHKLWPENQKPIDTWRRFKAKSENINRDDFIGFCNVFLIETNFPKFSLNIDEPDKLEKIILDQVDRLGIGIFPNNKRSKEEFILSLTSLIRNSRSKGTPITTKDIFKRFEIVTDFGSIEQNFPIDESKNILLHENISSFIQIIKLNKKIILTGEPGSGKSWFINNLINELKSNNINVIRHYCYTDLQDKFQKDRIRRDIFYGNLISDTLALYPDLIRKKQQRYASNLTELNLLINNIDEPTILIIDGLDHIQRIFNYRPYHDLTLSDIDIVNEINNINTSENLFIIVASQPIQELENIKEFFQISLPSWTIDNVKDLMIKLFLDDLEIDEQVLSDVLFEKSSGNPLYLTYLIQELKTKPEITLDIINTLPPYSYNLIEYYNYLLSKLNLKENVPLVLSAVNFNLTKHELKQITGLGDFVDESLNLLKPVLKQNKTSSGYSIYHESFRRFIIEYLKSKDIIEEKIFRPVIDWLESLDFYTYPKAYRYYLQLLIDSGDSLKPLKFISKDFIKNCVYFGHPWEIIENNYYFLTVAGTESEDIEKIILLNEINKTLIGIKEEYNDYFLFYIEAFGHNKDFESVANFLVFEGNPTLEKKQGIRVCYLIDSNNKVAPWEYYSDYFKEGESIELDDFKYYVRLLLVQNEKEALKNIAKNIKSGNLNDFRTIYKNELSRYQNIDFVNELKNENTIVNELITDEINKEVDKQDLIKLAEEILSFENVFDTEVPKIQNFFKQIVNQIIDNDTISKVISLFSGINWFYNWLIYYIKIQQIKSSQIINSDKLRSAFDFLAYKTEPFEGKPRTCDLYSLNTFIYNSLNDGLSLIKDKNDWEYILKILEKVSTETTTYLSKSPGGPIATYNFFKLLVESINEYNATIVNKILEKQYEDKKSDQFHAYLSEYCFQLVKTFAFINNIEKSDFYFKLGVDYLVGYTWRRDLTIEDLTESIANLHLINNTLGNEYILKLKDLVDAVVEHTDGKDTRHFPIEWFEKFYSINPESASRYLLKELVETRCDWRLESSLQHLIMQLNVKIDSLTKSFLNQTFLIESADSFLLDSLRLFDELANPTAKHTLIASIEARILIKQSSGYSKELQRELLKHSKELNLAEDYFSIHSIINNKKTNSINLIEKLKKECITRKSFSEMSTSELLTYLKDNSVSEREIQSLVYVFDNFQTLNIELKDLIKHLIIKNEKYPNEIKIDLTPIFITETDVSIYFWITRFIYQKSGWLESLFNIDAFKTAYKINPEKSLKYLFELLPDSLNLGYTRTFSANLFNALSSVGYNSSILIKAWLSMYEIIESRLPSRDIYNWEAAFSDELGMNLDEIHICLLICRFKSYTVQKFQIVLTGIAILLYSDSQKLIKPLKWFFRNHEYFKKSIILVIIELLSLHEEKNVGYVKNFESELRNIYPTEYFLIDYLIESLFNLSNRLKIKLNNELIYPIPDEEADFFLRLNYRHRILERKGLNINNIFGKFKATFSRKYKEALDLYGNRMREWSVNNLYFSDYLLELINEDFYNAFKSYPDSNLVYNDIKIDIKTIIAQYLSLNTRPKDLKKYSEYEGNGLYTSTSEISINEGWVRIGHFENELVEKEHYKLENYKIFGGITFNSDNKPIFPFSTYRLDMPKIWENIYPDYENQETIVFSLIQKQFQFEDFKILWLNPILVSNFKLNVCNFLSGLRATNDNGEIILKFNSWYTSYIASDRMDDIIQEIPKLDGSELLIREDYFKKICDLYSVSPKYCIMRTFKNSS